MILVAVACAVREHWVRLAGDQPATHRFLRRWAFRGIVLPSALWAFANLGLFQRFPAIVPDIAAAHASPDHPAWAPLWMSWTITGAGFIAIAWSAVTYTWMALIIARRAGAEPECRLTALLVGLPMLVLAFLIAFIGGWPLLPVALFTFVFPLVHCTINRAEKPAAVTAYGRAEGQIKFGKYEDAELEVISQLEKKENDFKGWMLLAELYATKYRRLDDAAQVIVDLCNDPTIQEIEISLACHKLADWQLEIGQNPVAARAAIELIIQRLPGTHAAQMAEARLKQMPRTRDDFLDQKKPRAIRLPSLRENAETNPHQNAPDPADKRAATLEANRLTARLQDDPNDLNARERLAILLAERLSHVNLGIDQLRLMLKLPEVPPERAGKWLAQIAEWERHLKKNEKAFRSILAEIIRDYPQTSFAMSARRQLELLEQDAFEKANATAAATPSPIRLKVQLDENT